MDNWRPRFRTWSWIRTSDFLVTLSHHSLPLFSGPPALIAFNDSRHLQISFFSQSSWNSTEQCRSGNKCCCNKRWVLIQFTSESVRWRVSWPEYCFSAQLWGTLYYHLLLLCYISEANIVLFTCNTFLLDTCSGFVDDDFKVDWNKSPNSTISK